MDKEEFGIDQLIASIGLLGSEFIRFDIDYFFTVIEWIEKDIGELTILRNLQIFPEQHKKDIKNYFLDKILYQLINFMIQISKVKSNIPLVINERKLVSSNDIKYPPESNKIKIIKVDEKKKTFSIDFSIPYEYAYNNHYSIEKYIISYEFLLNNFVHPIFENLFIKKKISKAVLRERKKYSKNDTRKYWPNHLKILAVKDYLESNQETKPIITLIEDLDTELRNALVHENYYIKDQVIHYFRIISEVKKIEIMRLHIKVVFLLFRLYFYSVLISMKFIESSKIKEILNLNKE